MRLTQAAPLEVSIGQVNRIWPVIVKQRVRLETMQSEQRSLVMTVPYTPCNTASSTSCAVPAAGATLPLALPCWPPLDSNGFQGGSHR